MTKKFIGGLASLLLALCLVSVTGSPSQADDELISVSASNVTYKTDDCYTSDITVSGLDPASIDGYDIQVTSPDGAWVDSTYVSGQSEDYFPVTLCAGVDRIGTYTVTVNGLEYASFTVTKPWIKVKRLSKRTVAGRLFVNGHGMAYKTIHVQVWTSGDWYDVLDVKTNRYGQFGIVCKRHYRCPWAFRFDYKYFVNSRSFHLYTGPKNGLVAEPAPTRTTVRGSIVSGR